MVSSILDQKIRAKFPNHETMRSWKNFLNGEEQTEIQSQAKMKTEKFTKAFGMALLTAIACSRTQWCRRPSSVLQLYYALLNQVAISQWCYLRPRGCVSLLGVPMCRNADGVDVPLCTLTLDETSSTPCLREQPLYCRACVHTLPPPHVPAPGHGASRGGNGVTCWPQAPQAAPVAAGCSLEQLGVLCK